MFFKLNTLFRLNFEKLMENWNANSKNVLSPFLYIWPIFPIWHTPKEHLIIYYYFTPWMLQDIFLVYYTIKSMRFLNSGPLHKRRSQPGHYHFEVAFKILHFLMFLIYVVNELKVGCKIHGSLFYKGMAYRTWPNITTQTHFIS